MSKYKRRYRTKFGRVDVYPIKRDHYDQMLRLCLELRDQSDPGKQTYWIWYRNFVFLTLGVNVGARAEDLLQLTLRNIRGGYFYTSEFKTGKKQDFMLNRETTEIVEAFAEFMKLDNKDYIFRSRQGKNRPLTRQQAYNMIVKLKRMLGIKYPIGCHSLRKSMARYIYDDTGDVITVMKMLNHSDPNETLQYICMEGDRMVKARQKFYGIRP